MTLTKRHPSHWQKITGIIEYTDSGNNNFCEKLYIGEYTLWYPCDLWSLWGYPGRLKNKFKKNNYKFAEIFWMWEGKCFGSYVFDISEFDLEELEESAEQAKKKIENGEMGSYIDKILIQN